MVKSFQSYTEAETDFSELYENSLFTTPQERSDLLSDKSRVAQAFLYNFFGLLGIINAAKPSQKRILLTYLKSDKKLRIDTIDDTNHDISLSLKLAHEADFFTNPTTAPEITRFLFKLKSGQIDHIDSTVVGKWAAALKPEFAIHIKDPASRQIFSAFRADGGQTIDVSGVAIALKARANKVGDGGDFKAFSKRFIGLTAISPNTTTAVAAPVANVTVATPTAPVAPAVVTPVAAAPAKLNWYQKQKLKKQQAASAAVAQVDDKTAAAAAAAAALKAAEEEENKKAQAAAAAVKKIPDDHINAMIKNIASRGDLQKLIYRSSGSLDFIANFLPPLFKVMFGFKGSSMPDVYLEVYEPLKDIDDAMRRMMHGDTLSSLNAVADVSRALKLLNKIVETPWTYDKLLKTFIAEQSSHRGKLIAMLLLAGYDAKSDDIRNLGESSTRDLVRVLYTDISAFKKLASFIAGDDVLLKAFTNTYMPVQKVLQLDFSRTNISTGYGYLYPPSEEYIKFGFEIIKAYKKPFASLLDMGITNISSYDPNLRFYITMMAYGMNDTKIDTLDSEDVEFLKNIFKGFLDTSFRQGYQELKKDILNKLQRGDDVIYDSSAVDGGGALVKALHDEFAADLIDNGWAGSKISKVAGFELTHHSTDQVLKAIGVSIDDLLAKHPDDPGHLYVKARSDGLSSITEDQVVNIIINRRSAGYRADGQFFGDSASRLAMNSAGEKEDNYAIAAKAFLRIAEQSNADSFKTIGISETLLRLLPYASAETVQGWMKLAKDTNNKYIMGDEHYSELDRYDKQTFVDVFSGVIQDCIGSDAEDYVDTIIESLPNNVVQKLRATVVGAHTLVDEVTSGVIKPFDPISTARLKQILLYNEIDLTKIVSEKLGKKKRSESYSQYFARIKKDMANVDIIPQTKVTPDPQADAKAINRIMIQRDHAGKHGDIYPRIDKVFDANLEYPDFEEFRKNNPDSKSIVPAYHGTGGIAAGMILRYGFKVIKRSDKSVVARMLGDGIYFTNKIDKSVMYVSNGGYSHSQGQKGYIMEMDTNLGERGRDYDAAGLGNDNILSPEWCVFNPKAQLRIFKVYEVELVSKRSVDQYLSEGVYSSGMKGFKQHLKEQTVQTIGNTTNFVFRDGQIPIVDLGTRDVTYVDFEEALSKKLIKQEMFDVSAQGPVIVFTNTKDQLIIDERYASHLGGDSMKLYIDLFVREMSSPQK